MFGWLQETGLVSMSLTARGWQALNKESRNVSVNEWQGRTEGLLTRSWGSGFREEAILKLKLTGSGVSQVSEEQIL